MTPLERIRALAVELAEQVPEEDRQPKRRRRRPLPVLVQRHEVEGCPLAMVVTTGSAPVSEMRFELREGLPPAEDPSAAPKSTAS